jgi:hypothetical protein
VHTAYFSVSIFLVTLANKYAGAYGCWVVTSDYVFQDVQAAVGDVRSAQLINTALTYVTGHYNWRELQLYPSRHSFHRFQIFGRFLRVLLSSFPSIMQCLRQVHWHSTIYPQNQSAHLSVAHSVHFPLHYALAACRIGSHTGCKTEASHE